VLPQRQEIQSIDKTTRPQKMADCPWRMRRAKSGRNELWEVNSTHHDPIQRTTPSPPRRSTDGRPRHDARPSHSCVQKMYQQTGARQSLMSATVVPEGVAKPHARQCTVPNRKVQSATVRRRLLTLLPQNFRLVKTEGESSRCKRSLKEN
jgi:hypothetical protein